MGTSVKTFYAISHSALEEQINTRLAANQQLEISSTDLVAQLVPGQGIFYTYCILLKRKPH
jgi:hypothetical protein